MPYRKPSRNTGTTYVWRSTGAIHNVSTFTRSSPSGASRSIVELSRRCLRSSRPSPASGTGTRLSVAIGCDWPPCTCSSSSRPLAGSTTNSFVSVAAATRSRPPIVTTTGTW